MVMFTFNVATGDGIKKSPGLGSGDIVKLEKLFPDNPVWKGSSHNVRHISIEQARALYDAMIAYYTENDVSDEQYQSGNFTGTFAVMSSLLSVFDDLIGFCQKELGFSSSSEAEKIVATKQQEAQSRAAQGRAAYRESVLVAFGKCDSLKAPATPAIRTRLEGKLAEYKERLEQWRYKHPDLAFMVEHGFRDTNFKIAVAEAVVGAADGACISLVDLYNQQFEKYGDRLNANELFTAWVVIADYLETPVPGFKGELKE